MNVLIDCTNLKVGGGIQVATSFLNDLNKLDTEDDNIIQELKFYIVLSPQMEEQFNKTTFSSRFVFIELNKGIAKTKIRTSAFLKRIESKCNIDKVFCVFGPSYYKSKVPKVVGYAIPHYIYEDSPFFNYSGRKGTLGWYIRKAIRIYSFKQNSNELIFETEDAQKVFCSKYKYDINKTHVVSNTLNSIFSNSELWIDGEFDFKASHSFLCLTANYKHKNLDIIPEVIDALIEDHYLTDFKFVLSLSKEELGFDDKYDKYIEYLGRIPLEKLPSLYKSITILFMPTLLEVFSTTYLEAMHMGVPIVASDMSFARDICSDSALYFEPVNAKDAATKLKLLSEDSNKRERLTRLGKINLKRFGTSKERSNKYLDIILKSVLTD